MDKLGTPRFIGGVNAKLTNQPANPKGSKTPKRRIRQNVWGNFYGYAGTRKVEDFGSDEWAAMKWLRFGSVKNEVLTEHVEQSLGDGYKDSDRAKCVQVIFKFIIGQDVSDSDLAAFAGADINVNTGRLWCCATKAIELAEEAI